MQALPDLAGLGDFHVNERAKTSGPASALADNADADDGDARFHRLPYRAAPPCRQVPTPSVAEMPHGPTIKRNRQEFAEDEGDSGAFRHQFAPVRHHLRSISKPFVGNQEMHTQKTTRKPVQKPKPALAGQYRAIGSAAIVAALLYTPRRKAITSAK